MASVRRKIRIGGVSHWADGLTESEIRGGTMRWGFRSDERAGADQAPSALALGAWGVGFCLTTQFLRYADFHKMNITNRKMNPGRDISRRMNVRHRLCFGP